MAYPLATARPWDDPGQRLLLDASADVGLAPGLRPGLIEPTSGQMVLTPIAERFLVRVKFEPPHVPEDIAARIRPVGRTSPVVIDPEVRFGVPTVRGISTAVLAETASADESIEALASDYGLDVGDVVAALNYEMTEWRLLLTAA